MHELKVKDEKVKTVTLKVIDIISDNPFDKEYIIFTKENDGVIYASELILNNDNYIIRDVETKEELDYINNEILNNDNE